MIITKKIIIKTFTVLLVFLINVNHFAAIVDSNDGPAFITKAEFDAMKNKLYKQISDYNESIDGKIDGAIAAYLSSIAVDNIEMRTVLYPSEMDDVIWCMKKDKASDKIKYSYGYPSEKYVSSYATVFISNSHTNYCYQNVTYLYASSADENRIVLTSSDNFENDFVWDRYVTNVKTSLDCFAYTNTYSPGSWPSSHTCTFRNGVPNIISGSGYYTDYNTINDFISFECFLQYDNQDIHNVMKGDVVCSNVVELTKGEHEAGTTYKNAIVYEPDTIRYICSDDKGWVCVDCADADTQANFSKEMTPTYNMYYSQDWSSRRSSYNSVAYDQTLTGKMPVFGMYKNEIDMALVKNKFNTISYGKDMLTDIQLVNGLPLFYVESDKTITWTPVMEDTSSQYNFYFSFDKFTGAPDSTNCLEVKVDGGTATKTPIIKSGQTISFTVPTNKEGIVWVKWSEISGDGGGGLCLGMCKNYNVQTPN